MTARELRLLRALRRGPLYEGAAELIAGPNVRRHAAAAVREGYATQENVAGVGVVYTITEAGEEIVAAMTP